MTKFFQKYFDGGALSKHWAYEEMHWIVRLLHEERYYRAVKMMLELSELLLHRRLEDVAAQIMVDHLGTRAKQLVELIAIRQS